MNWFIFLSGAGVASFISSVVTFIISERQHNKELKRIYFNRKLDAAEKAIIHIGIQKSSLSSLYLIIKGSNEDVLNLDSAKIISNNIIELAKKISSMEYKDKLTYDLYFDVSKYPNHVGVFDKMKEFKVYQEAVKGDLSKELKQAEIKKYLLTLEKAINDHEQVEKLIKAELKKYN
jgi:hypothetical protein